MECELLQSPMISYRSLLYNTTVLYDTTNLTVGGFTQPAIARNLIEIPSNSEKGLSHRFIWVFPNPLYQEFSELGKAN